MNSLAKSNQSWVEFMSLNHGRLVMVNPSGWGLTLFCSAGRASALHGMDEDEMILRPKNHPNAKRKLYLGQTATAIFNKMITSSNVEIHNFSKWDEQSWRMSTSSNGLKIEIESFSYWGFGLFSSGYANKITLSSQEEVGNRLIFDVISSLDFKPWEFKHPKAFQRWLQKYDYDLSLGANQSNWKEAEKSATKEVNLQIDIVRKRCEMFEEKLDSGRLAESLTEAYEEVEMASLALEDRNIPATERALSRCEALLINIDEIMNPDDDFSIPHGHVLLNDETDDGVTFVDLSHEEE